MTLNKLYKKYSLIKDIKLIGKEIVTEDKLCEVIGFYLCGRQLQLLLLEYDEKQVEYEKEQKELYEENERIITNRTRKRQGIYANFNSIVSCIKEIKVDDITYSAEESGSTRIMLSDYESTLIFSRFFEKGWQPKSIGKIDMENCFICTVMFKGKFDKIPEINDNPKITFKFRDDQKAQIVEQPIILEVDKEYKEKIYFTVKDTGGQHWIYINSVSVYDMLTETMKNFENPKLIERLTKEELIQMKADTEKRILDVCPKGKGFLSIEYESDCDQQIDLYFKEWLESEPICTNGITTFMVRPDKKTGKLGKALRAALIEEPLELNTKIVEAEIFSMYKTIENKDVVL